MRQRHLPDEHNTPQLESDAPLFSEESRVEETSIDDALSIQKAETVEDLASRLSQEVKAHQKAFILSTIGLMGFCGLGMVLLDYAKIWLGEEDWRTSLGALLVFGGATAGLIRSALKPRKRRREQAASLAKQEDVHSIGALIDILGLEDGKMHDIAMDALTRLLPRLKASDASLLTAAQRVRLSLVLTLPFGNPVFNSVGYVFRRADDREVEFRLAILKAFAQVGDSKALPVVERLANGKAETDRQRHIQAAAQECLPALQQLAQQEGDRQTLLRAADNSDTASDTLLRAATGVTPTDPDQLLRPSQSGS